MTFTSKWPARAFTIQCGNDLPRVITLKGPDRWALEALASAGRKGCTPIHNPAPRWAAYVHKLRKLGVAIETITEPHDGPFPGNHARYVLQSRVIRAGGDA